MDEEQIKRKAYEWIHSKIMAVKDGPQREDIKRNFADMASGPLSEDLAAFHIMMVRKEWTPVELALPPEDEEVLCLCPIGEGEEVQEYVVCLGHLSGGEWYTTQELAVKKWKPKPAQGGNNIA